MGFGVSMAAPPLQVRRSQRLADSRGGVAFYGPTLTPKGSGHEPKLRPQRRRDQTGMELGRITPFVSIKGNGQGSVSALPPQEEEPVEGAKRSLRPRTAPGPAHIRVRTSMGQFTPVLPSSPHWMPSCCPGAGGTWGCPQCPLSPRGMSPSCPQPIPLSPTCSQPSPRDVAKLLLSPMCPHCPQLLFPGVVVPEDVPTVSPVCLGTTSLLCPQTVLNLSQCPLGVPKSSRVVPNLSPLSPGAVPRPNGTQGCPQCVPNMSPLSPGAVHRSGGLPSTAGGPGDAGWHRGHLGEGLQPPGDRWHPAHPEIPLCPGQGHPHCHPPVAAAGDSGNSEGGWRHWGDSGTLRGLGLSRAVREVGDSGDIRNLEQSEELKYWGHLGYWEHWGHLGVGDITGIEDIGDNQSWGYWGHWRHWGQSGGLGTSGVGDIGDIGGH